MAFDVQAALERTGLPTSRSTIRRQGDEDNLLPDIYLIYSEMLVPGDFFDDRYHAMLHHVTVHICSEGNPREALESVIREMGAEGFSPTPEVQDGYDRDADLYVTVCQFEGEERMADAL